MSPSPRRIRALASVIVGLLLTTLVVPLVHAGPGGTGPALEPVPVGPEQFTLARVSQAGDPPQGGGDRSFDPSISDDGNRLVFSSFASDLAFNGGTLLYDRISGQLTNVGFGTGARISGDGTAMAYVDYDPDTSTVRVRDLDAAGAPAGRPRHRPSGRRRRGEPGDGAGGQQ